MKSFFLSSNFDGPHLLFHFSVGSGKGEGEKKRRGVWREAPIKCWSILSAVCLVFRNFSWSPTDNKMVC